MVTMRDIADKAGVSHATVSFVLNEKQTSVRISEKTRLRVVEAASELGYSRNELARAMVTGRNRVLGLLTQDAGLEHEARILSGALEEAYERDYLVKVLRLPQVSSLASAISSCADWRLGGIIALNFWQDSLDLLHRGTTRHRIPVAVVNDSLPMDWGIRVACDDEGGIRLAFQHLRELGHERIAFFSGPQEALLSQRREKFYRAEMENAGLQVAKSDVAYGGWWGEAPSDQAAAQLLATGSSTRKTAKQPTAVRPTAVICAGDPLAMVMVRQVRSLGLSVPRDVSVVGFANYVMATLCDPPLTTIAQPFEELGRGVVKHLVERIEGGHANNGNWNDSALDEVLPAQLIVRSSTAIARV